MAKSFLRMYRVPLQIIGMILFCLLFVLPTPSTVCESAPAFNSENAGIPAGEKKDLVVRGVRRYEAGDIQAARKILESAKSLLPSDPAVSYYLGVIYLQEGRRTDAISEWRQYISTAPDSEDAMKIRKYLTLLVREEAVAYARQAVVDESVLLYGPAADNAVAVVPFHNLGSDALGPLGKGMAAMLISDLSKVPDLQVVERVRLQALLQEMGLGASGVIDPETAPKIGKLLKTGHVVTGSLVDPEVEVLHISSVVMNTKRSEPVYTRDAEDALSKLFDLEKRIACNIVEGLGRDCDSMPIAFKNIHTRSYRAFFFWARGLDALDAGRFPEAREWFQKAIDEDPAFDLAEDAFASTPLPEMSAMSSLQMISSLSGESFSGVHAPPWRTIYLSSLKKNSAMPGNADTEALAATLREALRLAFSNEKDQRAGDCLTMALGVGYPPYLALKTMFEAGDGLDLDPLCESASASGVMKAVFAKAARDAVSQSDSSIYEIAQLNQCPCLRGENGLGYTPAEKNIDYFPPDPKPAPYPVSPFTP